MKVLIIDDSRFSQMSMAKLLKSALKPGETLETSFASDGMEGLKAFREINPDFVLVDLLMPRLDGKHLIKALEEKERSRVIVVSADVQKTIRSELEGYHIIAFVNKPLDEEKAGRILDYMRNHQ